MGQHWKIRRILHLDQLVESQKICGLKTEMSATSSNIQFHLGAAFTILSISAIIFLLVILWETHSNDLETNNRYFNNHDTSFQDISGRNLISICLIGEKN